MKKTLGFILVLSSCFLFASNVLAGALEDELVNAATGGQTDLVQSLLDRGANINAVDSEGYSSLRIAALRDHFDVVRLLLKKGADVNAKDDAGWTALLCAVFSGNNDIEIVRILIEHGADVNAKDRQGYTALRQEADAGRADIVRLLTEKGADVNIKDNDWNRTALMQAVSGRSDPLADENADYLEVVRTLLNKGADVNTKDKNGTTALDEACAQDEDVVRLLKAAGAKGTPQQDCVEDTGEDW